MANYASIYTGSQIDSGIGKANTALQSSDLATPPAIGGTTPNTGKFSTLNAYTASYTGPSASANATRFPNALSVFSNTSAGVQQNESHNIGVMGEGVANSSNTAIYGIGVYGAGYTNSATRCGGVVGEGHVSATGDTGSAIGVRGYANDTHAGGLNIGLYGNASGGSSNYALYMDGGDIYSTASQTWALNGNTLRFSGSTVGMQSILETATITASAPTATTNFDAKTQAVQYYTSNNANNWTLNIRGSSTESLNTLMATGETLTIAVLATNGATPYYPTALTIDGISVVAKWAGGTAPSSGNANAIDSYTYTVIKTGSATFTVLASQTKYA